MTNGTPTESPSEQMIYPPYMGPPRDLYELYMTTRATMVTNFYQLYFKLLELIDIGKEMLPDGYEGLRNAAENLLSDGKTYPKPGKVECTSRGTYRVGGSDLVEVRFEELDKGINRVDIQQATFLIPKVKSMDSRIFQALVNCGVIESKKPLLEDVHIQDVLSEIQERVTKVQQEKVEAEEIQEEVS